MKHRVAYVLLSLATWGLFATMAFWTIPEVAAEADGLKPFDVRPLGYSTGEAEAFLNALSEEGRVFYAETQHALDSVFPGLLVVWAGWTLWLLTPGPWHWGLIVLAVLSGVADYAENAAVAQLLDGFDPDLAARASRWTVVKSAAATVVYLAILWGLWQRWQSRRRH